MSGGIYFQSWSYSRCHTLFHLILFWKRNPRFITNRCLLTILSVYLFTFWKCLFSFTLGLMSFPLHFYTVYFLYLEFWLLILGIFSMTKVGECICCSSCFFCIGSFINLKKNTSQVKIDNSRQKNTTLLVSGINLSCLMGYIIIRIY